MINNKIISTVEKKEIRPPNMIKAKLNITPSVVKIAQTVKKTS